MFRKVHKKISTVFRKGTKPSIKRDISPTTNDSPETPPETAAVETDDLASSSGADNNDVVAVFLDLPCCSMESPQSQPTFEQRFETNIDSLAEENFNLQLQIFLLEEKLEEQQIAAKVEIEVLRKKLEEKEENLRQAAQTIDEMEQIRKEKEAENDVAFEELKEEILNLQMNWNEYKRDFGSKLNSRSRISEDTRDMDEECEQKIEEPISQNAKLSDALEGKEEEIESAEQCDKYVNANEDDEDLVNVKESEQSEQSAILALIGKLKMTRRYDDQDLLTVKESEMQPCTSKSTILTMKLENPKGVLENMLQFEQTYLRFNAEHNFPQTENLFLKGIINKLQRRVNEESLKAEEDASKKIESNFDEKPGNV